MQAENGCRPSASAARAAFTSAMIAAGVAIDVSRTQCVGILDHVRPAARGGARREQDKSRGCKYPGREIAPHGEVVGDILIGGIALPCQRYMRNELAALGIEPKTLHQAFELRLQLDQWPTRYHLRHHGARLFSAKTGKAVHG